MGGHGALTIALKNPEVFKSVSAFSPIVNPCAVPWGQKAFNGYLGDDKEAWKQVGWVAEWVERIRMGDSAQEMECPRTHSFFFLHTCDCNSTMRRSWSRRTRGLSWQS